MKKTIITILSALVLLTSCSDFLKETSYTKYPTDAYFNDEEEAVLFLYGCYNKVKNTVFGTDWMYLTDTMTDDVDFTSTNYARKNIAYLNFNSTNSLVKNIWGRLYSAVEQCNILIDKLEANPELSEANAANMIAEARFIRAWAYFQLVQLWGDVPLLTKPIYSISTDNVKPFRTASDDVYSFIISELEDVRRVVPAKPHSVTPPSGVSYPLTISKAAASLLLAKVYANVQDWEEVVDALSIFAKGTDVVPEYGLCSEFNYIFDTRYKAVPERGKEVLWEIVAMAETDLNNAFHREVAPTELKGSSGEAIQGATSGYQSYVPTYDLFSRYDPSDLRYRQGFQITSKLCPMFMKGYDVTTTNQNLGGCNVVLLRTADAYLLLSEAYSKLGSDEMSRFFLNIVRTRAQISTADETLAKEDLYDAILLERRLEFAGEGAYRLYDLRRTGRYVKTLKEFNRTNADLYSQELTRIFINPHNGKESAALSIPFNPSTKLVQEKHLLLPIPNDERISNNNLTQNLGWN